MMHAEEVEARWLVVRYKILNKNNLKIRKIAR